MNVRAEFITNPSNILLSQLIERFDKLEGPGARKNKRRRLADAQRFLLLYHSGGLTSIIQNQKISGHQKARLVSLILDIDQDNARKYLTELSKNMMPLLRTESNYKFLVNHFEQSKDGDALKVVELILWEIQSNKV